MSVDERTRAFREWIATILASRNITRSRLAELAGLSHSTLSRATTDDSYRINFRADTIAKIAKVGGIAPPAIVTGERLTTPGFGDPEALPYTGNAARELSPNQTIWTVNTGDLQAMGLLPGDRFILDQATPPKTRDIIVVQKYDHATGTATTLLRVFADGFAVTPLYLVNGEPRLWIDGETAVCMGTVIESWRTRAT